MAVATNRRLAAGLTADPAALADAFAVSMARLGPLPTPPHLAVAVSGGADSLALALLADAWARERGGRVAGLIVDHGLRAASAVEAAATQARLSARGIAAEILVLDDLAQGPGLAARARAARYRVLAQACRRLGLAHLLLGHHAADQAETVLIRALGGSGPAGLAAMPARAEANGADTAGLCLLRPLLGIAPARLRDFLRDLGEAWVEDPSNADRRALRPRLRALRADPAGTGSATRALVAAARQAGLARAAAEAAREALLAARAMLFAEG